MNKENKRPHWKRFTTPMSYMKFRNLIDMGKWETKHYRTPKEEYKVYCAIFLKKIAVDYKCERCDYEGPRIQIHHLKDQFHYPELATDQNNLIALCPKCHREEHMK